MQNSFSIVLLFVIDEKVWRNFTAGDFICDLELFPLPKYQISSFHCLSSHLEEFPIWNISFFADLADTYRIIPSASNAPSRESGSQENSTCLHNDEKKAFVLQWKRTNLLNQNLSWCLSLTACRDLSWGANSAFSLSRPAQKNDH